VCATQARELAIGYFERLSVIFFCRRRSENGLLLLLNTGREFRDPLRKLPDAFIRGGPVPLAQLLNHVIPLFLDLLNIPVLAPKSAIEATQFPERHRCAELGVALAQILKILAEAFDLLGPRVAPLLQGCGRGAFRFDVALELGDDPLGPQALLQEGDDLLEDCFRRTRLELGVSERGILASGAYIWPPVR